MQIKAIAAAAALAATALTAQAFNIPINTPAVGFTPPAPYTGGGTVNTTFSTGSPFEFTQLNSFQINGATYPLGVFALIEISNLFTNTNDKFEFTNWEFGTCTAACSVFNPIGLPQSGKFGIVTDNTSFSFVGFKPTIALAGGDYYVKYSGIAQSTSGQFKSSATVYTDVSVTAVPEPSTYALMLAGLGVVGFMARRRSTAKSDRLAA